MYVLLSLHVTIPAKHAWGEMLKRTRIGGWRRVLVRGQDLEPHLSGWTARPGPGLLCICGLVTAVDHARVGWGCQNAIDHYRIAAACVGHSVIAGRGRSDGPAGP